MYRTLKEAIEERRKGKSFAQVLENLLGSPKLLEEQKDFFSIFGELREGEWLDMTSLVWENIGVEKQIQYAKAYQHWYAKQLKIQVSSLEPLGSSQIEWVLIPPGKFWMGSPESKKNRDSNERRHLVTLSKPFWCGKYPVTQEQWQTVMGSNPSYFKGSQQPVERVSWEESKEFCSQLGLQLLSEAQWEYACRGGTTSTYSFGNEECNLEKYAWYNKNSENVTHLVGEKEPNAFGLYDMHGNIWEWCEDYYHHTYGEEATDPLNLSVSSFRVHRGGSWSNSADRSRSASRRRNKSLRRYSDLGLRVCKFL